MDRHKVSKTGDCRKLLGRPYGRNASSMTKIRSMFTLICCSLARIKMSWRNFCCRNVLAQDKIKVRRKLYPSLPHIGILGAPSRNCMLHLQFWDGALLPPAVLGWHLLTSSFFLADFSHALSRAAKFTAKKTINGIMAVLPPSTPLPLKMQNSPKTKMIKGIVV